MRKVIRTSGLDITLNCQFSPITEPSIVPNRDRVSINTNSDILPVRGYQGTGGDGVSINKGRSGYGHGNNRNWRGSSINPDIKSGKSSLDIKI